MSSTNVCILTGRLGRDPEMSYTPNGLAVTKFSMAVDSWDNTSKKEVPIWVNVVVFEKRAETVAQWCQKGTQVTIVSRLSIRDYTDRSQVKRQWVEFIASEVNIVAGMRSRDDVRGGAASAAPETKSWPETPGDEREF